MNLIFVKLKSQWRILTLMVFIVIVFSAGHYVENSPAIRIGFASASNISQAVPQADSVRKIFEKEQALFEKTMADKTKQYESLTEQQKSKTLTVDARKKLKDKSDLLAEEMRTMEQDTQRMLEQKGAQLYGPINKKIMSVLQTTANESGYNIILNSDRQGPVILYADKGIALDSLIVAKLKKQP